MHGLVNLFVRAAAAVLPLQDPIVEVGSFQVAGQAGMNLRQHFRGRSYLGVDMRPGPGVDQVEDVRSLSFADGSVGTLIMLSTLEHVEEPNRAISQVLRVLRPDGVLLLSTPFDLHIHAFPNDYWRFTPAAYDLLLRPFGPRLIGSMGPLKMPRFVFGVAFRNPDEQAARTASAALVRHYRAAIARDRQALRERRKRRMARALSALSPFGEVRRIYREQSRFFDNRFHFHGAEEIVEV